MHSLRTGRIAAAALVVPTGAVARLAVVADAGGTITLVGAAHTYSLEITCSGGPIIVGVRDVARYTLDGMLRVSVAGDVIGVEATGITATRFTDHEVDEHHMPTAAPVELTPAPIALGRGSETPSAGGTLARE